MARFLVPIPKRIRAAALLIAAPAILLIGFQNCGGMRSSIASSSVTFRLGSNGEKITGYEPTSMFTGGGQVVISGEGLGEFTDVKIDGASCLDKVLVSPNEINCRAPALSAGAKKVEIAGASMPELLSYVDFSKVNSVAGRNGMDDLLDGVGRLARLGQVGGMVSNGQKIYFTESFTNVVRSMDLETFEVKTLAGKYTPGNGEFANGIGEVARFSNPQGVAVKGNTLFIADRENCVVRKMDLTTNEVSVLVGTARTAPCSITDGPPGTAEVGRVWALLLDGDDLYTSEGAPGYTTVIRKINLSDLSITTVGGKVGLGTGSDGHTSRWSRDPASLTQTRILDPAIETAHPTLPDYDEYEFTISQPGAVAMRLHFTQVELGEYDKINIETAGGNYLEILTNMSRSDFWTPVLPVDTVVLDTWFYDGTYGFKVDKIEYTMDANAFRVHSTDGPATSVMVGGAHSMLKIGDDIYFTDNDLYLIRKLNLTTNIITAVSGGTDDGSRYIGAFYATGFSSPAGLAADSRYLYVSDLGMNRIIKMDLVTRESSVLTESNPDFGRPANIDGPMGNAAVMKPSNLIYDPRRGLFFDCGDVIRRIK